MKKSIGFAIKVSVTLGLFVLLFRPQTFGLPPDQFGSIKPGDMWRELQEAAAGGLGMVFFWLGFALIVKLTGMLCGVLRWRLLLRGQGLHMPFWYLVGSWFVGRTIGIFLPGTIGLDGYRLYDSSRYTGQVIKCTTVIAVEKLIGFIALTGLVFLTFPLGFRLLNINLAVLLVILSILAAVVSAFFLLLLNPRVIQVLVAVLPVPYAVRHTLNRLGAAATAYSGHRAELLLAVFFGIMVHAGTCFMYFGTMMAIRAANTNLLDILFASPLMIYGTVLGPSVGGEGIREIVFVTLLGGKSGAATAATFAHLGWWIGELVPFLIGLPIYVMRSRPAKAELEAELAEARKMAAAEEALPFSPTLVSEYRKKVFACLAAGAMAGLIAGALIGLGESAWLMKSLAGLYEMQMFVWGPVVYGLLFAGVGLGVAGALLFLYLLFDRFASWMLSFAFSGAGSLAAGGLVIGLWRFKRDMIDNLPIEERGGVMAYVPVVACVLGAAAVAFAVFYAGAALKGRILRRKPLPLTLVGLGAYGVLVVAGAGLAAAYQPSRKAGAVQSSTAASGPNTILVAIDALRADYLKLYDNTAVAATPGIEAFARDAVRFQNSFAQASWTKPSFATLFSGLYPESHTAYTKTAALPDAVETLAELLSAGGYYTKGFPNNPNVSPIFNFGQGFTEYTYLSPSLYFGASASASKLSMYEVLRKVRQRLIKKLGFLPGVGNMRVTDFYQPAEAVTREALAWLDEKRVPEGVPFYLYLHYMDPHDPFMDPDAPTGGYARASMEHPDPELEVPMRNAYHKEIEHLDRYLAALFTGLKERGLYDGALIVFTADHGEEFFDHEGWWHGYTLYDEMVHIPLMLKLPGNAHAGETNLDLARHVDLAPTMLHFAGLPKGGAMPGQTLYDTAGVFTNATIGYSYAHNDFEDNLLRAVRTKEKKLITANENNVSGLAPVELYDLTKDPHEQENLAGQPAQAETQNKLQEMLSHYRKVVEENAAEPAGDVSISSDAAAQLESLGYLGP